jgi:hypothetical protein
MCFADIEETTAKAVMREDQKHLEKNFIHTFQIRFVVKALQGDRRNRRDQANEYIDTRDEDEASGWRFE